MPHFFLMDESKMQEADAARHRARLHIRAFHILMQHKRYAHGIVTLFDGLHQALKWFYLKHAHVLNVRLDEELWPHEMFRIIEESDIVDIDFDFESFEKLMTRALRSDFDKMNPDFDHGKLWADIEKVFHALEILPYDLNSLPGMNEATMKAMKIN